MTESEAAFLDRVVAERDAARKQVEALTKTLKASDVPVRGECLARFYDDKQWHHVRRISNANHPCDKWESVDPWGAKWMNEPTEVVPVPTRHGETHE